MAKKKEIDCNGCVARYGNGIVEITDVDGDVITAGYPKECSDEEIEDFIFEFVRGLHPVPVLRVIDGGAYDRI